MTAPTWSDILREPFTVLIAGKRGAGKTATGHRLLEVFGDGPESKDAYIMGFPGHQADQLPDWIDTLPADISMAAWPEDSVVLIHEAHHILHARESMQTENLTIDKLVTVSRHKGSNIILETQQTQRLDRNAVAAIDGVIMKYPALMQEEFERKQMRTIVQEAKDVLDEYVTVHQGDGYEWVEKDDDLPKHAYVYSEWFKGEYPHAIQLADHWSENISRAYGDVPAHDDADDDADDGLDEDTIAILETVAEYEQDNRPFNYEIQGADYQDIGAHPPTIATVAREGYLEAVYSSSSSATRYRLTDKGWDAIDADEPSGPYYVKD